MHPLYLASFAPTQLVLPALCSSTRESAVSQRIPATACLASPALPRPLSSTYEGRDSSIIKAEYTGRCGSGLVPESLLQVYLLSVVTKTLYQLIDSNVMALSPSPAPASSSGVRPGSQLPRPLQ